MIRGEDNLAFSVFPRKGATMAKKSISDADKVASSNLRGIWEKRKKEWKVTQSWAAEKLNMTDNAVNKYLTSKMPLGIQATVRWAQLLKVDPSEIRPDFEDLIPAHQDANINRELLTEALSLVDMMADESHTKLHVDERAKIATIAYEEGVKLGHINKESIRTMIKYAVSS